MAFTDHATAAGAAELPFTISPDNLSPTDVVYAPFAVRLTDGTTNDALVTLTHETVEGSVADLTYGVQLTDDITCSAATVGEELVPAGTPVGTVPADTDFGVTFNEGAVGDTQFLCFAVTAGAIVQGQEGSVTWEFNAVSQA